MRNYTHGTRAPVALSEGPAEARWHWCFAQSPSTGASPCADSIGFPLQREALRNGGDVHIPCPHFDIAIISRGKGRSVMAAAAYQSGEKLHSQYTGTWEYGREIERIDHTEILLPPNAPKEFSDRETLWNAVDAAEKGENAQTARRLIIALPKELSLEENITLIRQYCRTVFVDKGMIADIAVHHSLPDGNPHAHVLLTMRAMDEHGKWLPKSKNTYALDENGNRIIGQNGKPKRIKVDTVDWNDRGKCEIWRHEWEVKQNEALEQAGRSERIDMRSYERQGVETVPQVHLGPAASALERSGSPTQLAEHNKRVRLINSILGALKRQIAKLTEWLKELSGTIAAHETIVNPHNDSLPHVLMAYVDLRSKEREGWHPGAQDKGHINDLSELVMSCAFLEEHGIETLRDFAAALNRTSQTLSEMQSSVRYKEKRIRDIDSIIQAARTVHDHGPVLDKYNSIHFKTAREKFYQKHSDEIDGVKKAQWLLKKLNVGIPIDAKALRREAKGLREEVESRLPQLEQMKAEMKQLSKIRSHIRKVIPYALTARTEDGKRTYEDYAEEKTNQQALDNLLQESVDETIRHSPSPALINEIQTEKSQTRGRGARSHDEAR